MNSLKDGEQVTRGVPDCETPLSSVKPETPLRERALCYFEYFLNYNPLVSLFCYGAWENPGMSTNKISSQTELKRKLQWAK